MCTNPTLRSQAPACLLHLGLPWRRGPKIKKSVDDGPDSSASQQTCASRGRKGLQHDPICTIPERPCRPTRPGSPLPSQTLAPRSSHGLPTVVPRSSTGMDDVRKPHTTAIAAVSNACRRGARQHSWTCIRLGIVYASHACATQRTARVPASHLAGGLNVALCF